MSYIDEMIANAQRTQNDALPTSLDDPRMQQAKNYVAQHGGNAKEAFYALCRERMFNPAVIINRLTGMQN